MFKIMQIDSKIFQKCVSYRKIPIEDKKRGTCPQNHTAGPSVLNCVDTH